MYLLCSLAVSLLVNNLANNVGYWWCEMGFKWSWLEWEVQTTRNAVYDEYDINDRCTNIYYKKQRK